MTNDELWTLYRLEKHYYENGIERDHPARVEVDFFHEAFADMWDKEDAIESEAELDAVRDLFNEAA